MPQKPKLVCWESKVEQGNKADLKWANEAGSMAKPMLGLSACQRFFKCLRTVNSCTAATCTRSSSHTEV